MSLSLQHPYLKIILNLSLRRKTSVYLVGGFLRDQYLNRSGADFDFAVSKNAVALARAFSQTIKGSFVLLDEEHPCGRVIKKEKGQILTFDFSDFRAASLDKDLQLRDFTINALCLKINDVFCEDALTKKLIDRQGGLKDLKSKTVRMVADRAFVDDPLRLMRAFSLFAQLGFKIEAKTMTQIKKDVALINKVSMERIREEFFKVLASGRTFETLNLMHKAGLLQKVIPQLSVMEGVHQGGYHHLDVWKHTLEVVNQFEKLTDSFCRDAINGVSTDQFICDYLQEDIAGGHKRYALIKFACLLHDIGKPETKKQEADRMTFHGHEHVGAHITRLIAKQLKLSVKERHFLEDAVIWHLRPGYLSNFKKPSERMIFRYLRDTQEEALSILLLAIADQRSTCGPLTDKPKSDHHFKICQMVISRFIESKNQKPVLRLITGNDLIKKLKLKPSSLFAEILTKVAEAQALGQVSDKNEALALAKKIAKI
ncbi:MAG: HD domain-containing protein [Candidatus Omnitrophica bacterium]|nr:HD domain-containing protein [Candidatus Omnitrophota bacterium]